MRSHRLTDAEGVPWQARDRRPQRHPNFADRQRRKRLLRFDLQDRKMDTVVSKKPLCTDNSGRPNAPIDVICPLDDMVVGHNSTVRLDEDPRSRGKMILAAVGICWRRIARKKGIAAKGDGRWTVFRLYVQPGGRLLDEAVTNESCISIWL